MAIITISRGSYSRGQEVAEKVAEKLRYSCISRDVVLEASREFNTPEIKLIRAIHDAPSILERFAYGKDRFIAFVEAALLRHFKNDDTVYCGLAGHFFVRDVTHVLKVRIVAEFEDRVACEMAREGIDADEAAELLEKDDAERLRWSMHLYGIDTADPTLYDLIIHIKKLSVDDAVDIICRAAELPQFTATPESQDRIDDLSLAAEVRAAIVDAKPDARVVASKGHIRINMSANESQDMALVNRVKELAESIEGVQKVETNITPSDPVD